MMTEEMNRGPTQAIVLNRDLLFGSRIRNALASLGLEGRFAATPEEFVRALVEQASSVTIGIIDMNGHVSWTVIGEALSRPDRELVPTLAFGPHVDIEGRRNAKAAGVTRIVSNGQFHSDMAGLIDRYRRR
jgi:methylmalonyl-CoA mutase cobalamin-binding subunit